MIEITEVKVYPGDWGKTKAMASITIDNVFVVTGLKIIEGTKGYFVAMPSRKSGDEYKDVCFPITKEAREYIETAVLTKFEESGSLDYDTDYDAVVDVADEELPF